MPLVIAEHHECQVTGSQYPTERKVGVDIIPAPLWAFSLDRFSAQVDQNIWTQLPRSSMVDVNRPLGPQREHGEGLDLAELLEGQRELRCPLTTDNPMYVVGSKILVSRLVKELLMVRKRMRTVAGSLATLLTHHKLLTTDISAATVTGK